MSLECPGTTEHVETRGTEGPWELPEKKIANGLMGLRVEKASRPRLLRETGNNVRGKMLMMEEIME